MQLVDVEQLEERLQKYLLSMSKFDAKDSHEVMVSKVLMRQGAEEMMKVVKNFINNKGE